MQVIIKKFKFHLLLQVKVIQRKIFNVISLKMETVLCVFLDGKLVKIIMRINIG